MGNRLNITATVFQCDRRAAPCTKVSQILRKFRKMQASGQAPSPALKEHRAWSKNCDGFTAQVKW